MKEQISALMDGELDLDSAPHLYKALCKSEEAGECWTAWHAIGDAMRGEYADQKDLRDRVMRLLESEPTVLAPRSKVGKWLESVYVVPMAATAAAVAFVGWMVWQPGTGLRNDLPAPSVAQNAIPAETLNSYMLAHHEYATSNGMLHAYDLKPANFTEPGN